VFGNWPEQIRALQRLGLRVAETNGQEQLIRLNATNDLGQIPLADYVLVLVKGHQTARAARQAANILRPNGLAITLQNGLGNLVRLAEVVGQRRAAAGITAQGAEITAPGKLRHAGTGPTYLAGTHAQVPKLQRLVDLFSHAGLETALIRNADSLIWGKLAINAGINPLTALLEIPNGLLAERDRLRIIMRAAATEVAAVATAQGIDLPFPDAADRTEEVSRATAANHSSMLQDIKRGVPTEIDAISGEVVRIGRQLGVPTPVNRLLFNLVKSKEERRITDLPPLQPANQAM
jgi:2-dehydropantoate 2-reductase